MALSASPVEDGFVASLARPGGNVTGLTGIARELIGRRLEVLKAAVPGVSRVGVLWNPEIHDRAGEFRVVEGAAAALGLELRSLEARDAATLPPALEQATLQRADALYLLDNPVTGTNEPRISEFALAHRLPTMSGNRRFATVGGLIAYGTNDPDMARRAAAYVDKILKGAKPADLPVERPALFDFVINLKTAQALGLSIPPAVQLQATEFIQ
jgi:putative ABC transport system substrate-binding protein